MIPGEITCAAGTLTVNAGRDAIVLHVVNTGDRPVQVGSHFHLAQVNDALSLDRAAAQGRRLDIPAGTAVRFEPGIPREVQAVAFGGRRVVPGIRRSAGRAD